MNCVNSISQMNPSSCEHSSLIPQDKKFGPSGPGGPTPGSSEKDEGFEGKPNCNLSVPFVQCGVGQWVLHTTGSPFCVLGIYHNR